MYMLMELAIAVFILIPVFLVLWKVKFHSFHKTILYVIFASYLAAVYHFVGLPTIQFFTFDINLTLIPFLGMIDDLRNIFLNVLLFAPLGFFLPLMWKKYRKLKDTLVFGLGMTITIEFLQLFTYRATDINDIITNVLGTMLGFYAFGLTKSFFCMRIKASKSTKDIPVIFFATIAVMFLIQPCIMTWVYRMT